MITVLMAAKTSTQYMPQAIGSLMGQSYQDWELVLGVNGIPDEPAVSGQAWLYESARVANQIHYEALMNTRVIGSRTTVLNLPQCRNKAEALNEMVRHAKGDFVAILDVDDLWHPLKLETQLKAIERLRVAVQGTRGRYFDYFNSEINVKVGAIYLDDLRSGNCLLNSSVVMQRELASWESMDQPIEDYALWLRLAREGRSIVNIDDELTFIRQHDDKWSHKVDHADAVKALRRRYA